MSKTLSLSSPCNQTHDISAAKLMNIHTAGIKRISGFTLVF